MALGEHVLDLPAAFLEPGGHIVLMHGVGHFRLQALALADEFHGIEGHFRGHALLHELVHDILAGTQALAQGYDALVDQVFRVAQPHVGAVGKTRNTD